MITCILCRTGSTYESLQGRLVSLDELRVSGSTAKLILLVFHAFALVLFGHRVERRLVGARLFDCIGSQSHVGAIAAVQRNRRM